MCSIIFSYVFSMLSLGHIVISDLVIANLFMHSLPGMILLYLAALFTPKMRFIIFCWFVRGRIKEKISTIYAIKYQVYCMENTVQWSANTVQLF